MTSDPTAETDRQDPDITANDVLVSVEGAADDGALVRAAADLAVATGGRLTVLNVMPSGAFADRQHARARVEGLPRFTLGQAEAERERTAAAVAREALAGNPVEYDCVGVVGREPACILGEARARGCGHVVVGTRRRSSLGAVRATEVVRAVVESFEGLVTVVRSPGDSDRRHGPVA
jgi:nucleotide-binding universal stress UspA family protein